ncbi:hypothetical protein ACSQ67_025299 [Phaseolus vulgaris]
MLDKHMGSILKEKDETDVEALKVQLVESSSSLQYALLANNNLVGQNKDLVVELAQLKLENDSLLTRCLIVEEKGKDVSAKNDSLK